MPGFEEATDVLDRREGEAPAEPQASFSRDLADEAQRELRPPVRDMTFRVMSSRLVKFR